MNEFCRLTVVVPFAQIPYCVSNTLSNIQDIRKRNTFPLSRRCTIDDSLTTFCVNSALSAIFVLYLKHEHHSKAEKHCKRTFVKKYSSSRLCGKEERIAQKA